MKKLFNIIFIMISITSLLSECQSNLDQATKTVLDNVAAVQKKLDSIPQEIKRNNTHLTAEQIIQLLLVQNLSKDSELAKNLDMRKNAHRQLQVAAVWFQQPKNILDWTEYLAIHNQMFLAIQSEFNQLKQIPQLHEFCKEISETIITALLNAITSLYINEKVSKNDIHSLLHAYQNYVKLFENYVTINDPNITEILRKEGLS